jgi:hypothetical protein
VRLKMTVHSTILAVSLASILGASALAQDAVGTKQITVARGTVAGEPFDVTLATWDDETGQMTGRLLSVVVESSDPRLTGTMTMSSNGAGERYGDGAIIILRSTFRLVNDEGAWVGQGWEAEARPAPDQPAIFHSGDMLLEGEGAYAGLTAYLTDDYQGEVPAIKAVIIENTLPPTPAPITTAE